MSGHDGLGGWAITTSQNESDTARAIFDFALAAAELAANTRCDNVVVLDLRGRSPATEFFVIVTGTSPRQMRTVADELSELGQRQGFRAWRTSGYESAKWILIDFVNVVAHVFDTESRDFYDLELLWGDCPRINWRAELGLPEETRRENPEDVPLEERLSEAGDEALADARREEAHLEGQDEEEEEGDADVDEDAEAAAPMVMELPDLSTGSNSVEFVEIDPPAERRKRGKAVFPTPLQKEEEEEVESRMRPVAEQSLDEDVREFEQERVADRDVEAIAAEDLPAERIETRPMGGVSAGLSSTTLGDDEEQQRDSVEMEEYGENREGVPPAHETAADAILVHKPTSQTAAVEITTETEANPPGRRKLVTRGDEKGAVVSAPGPTNTGKAKAGVVRAKSAAAGRKTGRGGGKKAAAGKSKSAAKGRAATKPAAKKPATRPVAKKKAGKAGTTAKEAVKAKMAATRGRGKLAKAAPKGRAKAKGPTKKPTKKTKKK